MEKILFSGYNVSIPESGDEQDAAGTANQLRKEGIYYETDQLCNYG